MKKAMAGLDEEQREALLYLADLGLAICSAALAVGFLQAVVGLAP
jgi:ABC-type nickel/cobalt efflux system permease component RcnA